MKLSKNGVEKKLANIKALEEKLSALRLSTTDFSTKGTRDGSIDDSTQVYHMNDVTLLEAMIRAEKQALATAEIINEESFGENVIDLGDTVSLMMYYADGDTLDIEVNLSDIADINEVLTISINSPVGAAIYGQEVGNVVECETPEGRAAIQILSKRKARVR